MDYVEALRAEFVRSTGIPAEQLKRAYNAALTYTKCHYMDEDTAELAAYSMVQECLWQMHGKKILSESEFLSCVSPEAWDEIEDILSE